MKMLLTMVGLAALVALPMTAQAQVVASDASYTITRSTGAAFTSISTTGTALTSTAAAVDDVNFNVTLAAPFTFYGTSFTTIGVSTNGLITFGGTNTAFTNTALSATAPTLPSVAVYWDDLFFFATPNTGALYSLTSGTTTTLEWNQVGYFGQVATSTLTFQAVLNSATGRITLNYPDTSGPAGFSDAQSATVGIKGTTTFAQVGFNTAGTVVAGNTLTVVPVPEPTTLALTGAAGVGFLVRMRRKKAAAVAAA